MAKKNHGGRRFPMDDRIVAAVVHHDGKWPKDLPSGVMFFMGLKITRAEFNRVRNGRHD